VIQKINSLFILRFLASLALLLSLSLAGCSDGEPRYALADGKELKFSDLQGRIVLINYWAEWCKPCRKEIPELNALQQQYGDQVQVLGVNFDGIQGDALIKQTNNLGIEFPILTTDPRAQFSVEASGVLPETLVIDPQGVFEKVLLGPQTLEQLQTIIKAN
jgi:thiol-disulfide isomerase/thioredoxin